MHCALSLIWLRCLSLYSGDPEILARHYNSDANTMTYPIGKSLPVASGLVRQSRQSPVYLVDDYGTGTILRHIVSEQAFNAFGFDSN